MTLDKPTAELLAKILDSTGSAGRILEPDPGVAIIVLRVDRMLAMSTVTIERVMSALAFAAFHEAVTNRETQEVPS